MPVTDVGCHTGWKETDLTSEHIAKGQVWGLYEGAGPSGGADREQRHSHLPFLHPGPPQVLTRRTVGREAGGGPSKPLDLLWGRTVLQEKDEVCTDPSP